MTLNNVLNRIKTIALSHRQIRNFQKGLVSDFLTDHGTKYPSVFLQSNGGSISTGRHAAVLNYRMFVLDLVHVSSDHEINEDDVLSDMLSISLDLVAQINNPNYDDWILSTDNNLQELVQYDTDMIAGFVFDFTIKTLFKQDRCEIPSDIVEIPPGENNDKMKYVYDIKYIATGAEGKTISTGGSNPAVPELFGKKILLITRENSPLYKVSNAPDSVEFTWDNSDIVFGRNTNPGERYLFLYRTY